MNYLSLNVSYINIEEIQLPKNMMKEKNIIVKPIHFSLSLESKTIIYMIGNLKIW